jgi:hypothetical protein
MAGDPDDLDAGSLDDLDLRPDDPVSGLHDTEAEAGDEAEVDDSFDLDQREARELGVNLDEPDGPEPRLD